MMKIFLRKPLHLIKKDGSYFYHLKLETFDRLGIFSFILKHERLGYLYKEESKNVVFKYYEDDSDRRSLFSMEALPYTIIMTCVFLSALMIVMIGIKSDLGEEIRLKRNKAKKPKTKSKKNKR